MVAKSAAPLVIRPRSPAYLLTAPIRHAVSAKLVRATPVLFRLLPRVPCHPVGALAPFCQCQVELIVPLWVVGGLPAEYGNDEILGDQTYGLPGGTLVSAWHSEIATAMDTHLPSQLSSTISGIALASSRVKERERADSGTCCGNARYPVQPERDAGAPVTLKPTPRTVDPSLRARIPPPMHPNSCAFASFLFNLCSFALAIFRTWLVFFLDPSAPTPPPNGPREGEPPPAADPTGRVRVDLRWPASNATGAPSRRCSGLGLLPLAPETPGSPLAPTCA